MKLIIDIPDETYQALMADTKIRDPNKNIFKAIARGKPVCEVLDSSDIENLYFYSVIETIKASLKEKEENNG